MELNNEHRFLEDLLALRRETLEDTIPNFPLEMNELFSSGWSTCDFFDNDNNIPLTTFPSHSFYEGFCSRLDQEFNNYYFNEVSCPFGDEFSLPKFAEEFSAPQITDSSYNTFDTPPLSFPVQDDDNNTPVSLMENDQEMGLFAQMMDGRTCKVEPNQSQEVPVFDVGICPERKVRGKKMDGKPSKNLMAERRRRQRLNDRLSMLRSIVPKISKMDRTSILGDTIDYVKELMEKINNLEQQLEVGSDKLNIFKESKASEIMIRNAPKFDVERRNGDTRIEICCATKPGLLLSTLTTLEALDLEIEQCVISCFNDFAMQASCSEEPEELEQRREISSEEIKQALFRSAGYGGRCL